MNEKVRVLLERAWDQGYLAGAFETSIFDEDNNPYRSGSEW